MIKFLIKECSLLTNYWLAGGIGCSLLGAGLCILIEAGFAKHAVNTTWQSWFWLGLLGLIVFNSGIGFIGTAIQYKIKLDE
jgi:drug/metabolite transporter (DMT)-like permease